MQTNTIPMLLDRSQSMYFYNPAWREKYNEDLLCGLDAADSNMEPVIHRGDQLLIDKEQSSPEEGRVFALAFGDSVCLRRLVVKDGEWWAVSDNLAFTDTDIRLDEAREIIGRAVEVGSTHGLQQEYQQ